MNFLTVVSVEMNATTNKIFGRYSLMNEVQAGSGYGKIADPGTLHRQNPSDMGRHGGRDVVVNSQPSATALFYNPPPSYQQVMAQDQENHQRSAAVFLWVATETSRLSSEPHRPPQKGCCERFCDNGTCGDLVACCAQVCCLALCGLLTGG